MLKIINTLHINNLIGLRIGLHDRAIDRLQRQSQQIIFGRRRKAILLHRKALKNMLRFIGKRENKSAQRLLKLGLDIDLNVLTVVESTVISENKLHMVVRNRSDGNKRRQMTSRRSDSSIAETAIE